jgi:hypothetical protein
MGRGERETTENVRRGRLGQVRAAGPKFARDGGPYGHSSLPDRAAKATSVRACARGLGSLARADERHRASPLHAISLRSRVARASRVPPPSPGLSGRHPRAPRPSAHTVALERAAAPCWLAAARRAGAPVCNAQMAAGKQWMLICRSPVFPSPLTLMLLDDVRFPLRLPRRNTPTSSPQSAHHCSPLCFSSPSFIQSRSSGGGCRRAVAAGHLCGAYAIAPDIFDGARSGKERRATSLGYVGAIELIERPKPRAT